MKYIFVSFFLIFFLFKDVTGQDFSILGKWVIVKRVYLDERYTLTHKESLECTGHIVSFYQDSILTPMDTCFYGLKEYNPNYKLTKVNTLQYYEGDTSYLKLLGIAKDSINIVNTDVGVPFDSIDVLDNDNIICGMDNYAFFLRRFNSKKISNK